MREDNRKPGESIQSWLARKKRRWVALSGHLKTQMPGYQPAYESRFEEPLSKLRPCMTQSRVV